ncbi:MAG: hypothetical protein MK312_13765, partial [Roseibacillus sp.]|nr:hypothetical protein [Roseibacillus sp.]
SRIAHIKDRLEDPQSRLTLTQTHDGSGQSEGYVGPQTLCSRVQRPPVTDLSIGPLAFFKAFSGGEIPGHALWSGINKWSPQPAENYHHARGPCYERHSLLSEHGLSSPR